MKNGKDDIKISLGPHGELFVNGVLADGDSPSASAVPKKLKRFEVFCDGKSSFRSDSMVGERVAQLLITQRCSIDVYDSEMDKTFTLVPVHIAVVVRKE